MFQTHMSDSITERLDDLQRRLTYVARGWPPGAFFASERLWFGSRLEESQIAAVEQRYGILLPADYRGFLTRIGNGGQAFDVRLLSFSEAIAAADHDRCRLQEPFPFTGETAADKQIAQALTTIDDNYCFNGALRIGDHGCAYYDYLILNGPHSGTVWHDGREFEAAFLPCASPAGDGIASYLDWLIEHLRSG